MLDIRALSFKDFDLIIPFIQELMGHKLEDALLKERFSEMFKQNYECFGIYEDKEIIGIFGLWFMTRHYAGKSCEPDHVFINPEKRSSGIGKKVFQWIFNYAKSKGCETSELNSYTKNFPSHKFYLNQGYEIFAFHFYKTL